MSATVQPTNSSMSLFRAELRLNIAENDEVTIAATLVAPRDVSACTNVVCAIPGGGYNRRYYDLHHPLLAGETQAEWHARRGLVFIAFDPYGGGDSTELAEERCDLASTIRVVHGAVVIAVDRLRAGTLAQGLKPIPVSQTIGIGHSLGGMQLVAQQAEYATFDAIGVLGFSAVHSVVPTPDGRTVATHSSSANHTESLTEAWSGPLADDIANIRYCYHWEENVPKALVDEDMSSGFPQRKPGDLPFYVTRSFPPFAKICLQKGIIAREAAQIKVPVFVATGERDITRDIRREALAYQQSIDITLFEISQCAHMHNFSPRRESVWARLQSWIDGLQAS